MLFPTDIGKEVPTHIAFTSRNGIYAFFEACSQGGAADKMHGALDASYFSSYCHDVCQFITYIMRWIGVILMVVPRH